MLAILRGSDWGAALHTGLLNLGMRLSWFILSYRFERYCDGVTPKAH
jgi:hypothetical protein